MNQFGFESTTDDVLEGIDLQGKQVVVTGATSGLGLETARSLASKGADVVIMGRNETKLQDAKALLLDMGLSGSIDSEKIDLADLESVRAAAGSLLKRYSKVDILVNNAGVMVCPLGRTKQGFEMQFGTNHIGHFLFTCLLAPALIAAAPSRVVNLASSGHRIAPLDLEDVNFESKPYNKWLAYGASKSANVLFAVGLDSHLKSKNVRAYAVHPGVIQTDLMRHFSPEDAAMFEKPVEPFKLVAQGAATGVRAATSPDLANNGGVYLKNCQIAEVDDSPDMAGGVKSYAVSPENAERLWTISEELVGEKFAW